MVQLCLLIVSIVLSFPLVETVQIVGLFRENKPSYRHADPDMETNVHWIDQSIGMFRAAIKLAERYEIRVGGKRIGHTILRTNVAEAGLADLDCVCDLIIKTGIQDVIGIVGSYSSSSTRFLASLAAHIKMPLVSYGATNADLADVDMYETFYRTVPTDALLVKAIVQLFKFFSWTKCSLVFENDDYGYGGLKMLSETYYSQLFIEQRVIYDSKLGVFYANLSETLQNSRSRIILVWANSKSTTSIIRHALDQNLLSGPFVWLMTSEVRQRLISTHFCSSLTFDLTAHRLRSEYESLAPIHPFRMTKKLRSHVSILLDGCVHV